MKYVGSNYHRKEDYRLLSGTGQYVADIQLTDMLEVAFVRSTYAHAWIKTINKEEAEKLEGVFEVITGEDLEGQLGEIHARNVEMADILIEKVKPIIKKSEAPVLAKDKVVYMGQPIAAVIASNRYIAEDGAGLVDVDYEPLPAVTDPYEALKDEATVIYPEMGDNLQGQFHMCTNEQIDSSLESADHIISAKIKIPRVGANPLETRGIVAEFNRRTSQMQVWASTQGVYMVRHYLAKLLKMPEQSIRVIAPDVGGGFGPKSVMYPEYTLIPFLARKFNRPMKWIEDRLEHQLSTYQSRDQTHDVKVGFMNDGTIVALKDEFVQDMGSHNPTGLTTAYNSAVHLRGIYKIPHYSIKANCVITNKAPLIAYRGAGRPEVVFVMDRIIDKIATKLNVDTVEIMFKNMIHPEEMPYDQGIIYRDSAKVIYDQGDYPDALKKAMEIVDYHQFRQEQKLKKKNGEYIGIGISSYIEGTGIGPYEAAKIRVDTSGQILLYVGSTPHGQSHETTMAQICADVLEISPEQITVIAGDSSVLPYGGLTVASRTAVAAGSAVFNAARKVKDQLMAVAANMLNQDVKFLGFKDGTVFSKDAPFNLCSIKEIAIAALPGPKCKVPEGMEPGIEATDYFVPPSVTYASGFHIAVVEVDKETGFVEILDYIVVHDCGQALNPMIVDGQVQGGVAQGIGEAIYEEMVYDERGQLLTGSYMDYLLPTSMEVPTVKMAHQVFQSERNPIGVKGVGEAGAISPPAAIANAVIDALHPLKIDIDCLPISPNFLRNLIEEAEKSQIEHIY